MLTWLMHGLERFNNTHALYVFVVAGMMRDYGPPVKRPRDGPIGPRQVVNHLNGKTRLGSSARIGRKQVISWMDAPDDVYFRSTDTTK